MFSKPKLGATDIKTSRVPELKSRCDWLEGSRSGRRGKLCNSSAIYVCNSNSPRHSRHTQHLRSLPTPNGCSSSRRRPNCKRIGVSVSTFNRKRALFSPTAEDDCLSTYRSEFSRRLKFTQLNRTNWNSPGLFPALAFFHSE